AADCWPSGPLYNKCTYIRTDGRCSAQVDTQQDDLRIDKVSPSTNERLVEIAPNLVNPSA
ncbi:MAG: hypothetical protein V7706_19945, partial [Dietzia psychralcaliphila]